MDGTSIDKLYLDIAVNNKGTTRTINAVTKSLDKLTASISAFDAKGLHKKFDSLFRILNNADATGFANLTKNLSGVANAFSKITNASKIDTKGLYAKFNSLTRIITPFVDKVKEGETSLVALAQTLKSMKSPTSTGGGKTSNGGTNKNKKDNVNIFATLGKWNYMINMARYYSRSLANIVKLSMDYVETQNLWQVANRNNIAQASEFIDKMNKAYGISEQTLMNYQALFKTMLSSLGDLSDMMSTTLSQQITQMALDFSSLYNVSIADAMTKFQAVLSGQVRPIRSVSGYDITENTIYDIYSKMGGEKTMRQLSQLEKRLLRIYAVFDQMSESGAKGDLAKTINSASNQARIMNEQFKEAMTWTGQIILSWLNSTGVFTYINAVLMTISQVMKAIAYDSGAVPQDFFGGIFESADETNEAIDELQGKLLSFDRFEALNSDKGTNLGIDPIIEDLIKKIDIGLGNVNMEAQKLSDKWLNQIGLGEELYRVTLANGEVVTYTRQEYEKLDDATKATFTNVENYRAMGTEFEKILGFLKPIVILMGVIAGATILSGIGKLLSLMTNLHKVFSLSGVAMGLFVSGLVTILTSDLTGIEKLVALLTAMATALAVAVTAKAMFSSLTIGKALAIGGIIAGTGALVASSIPKYATGGFPEDGLFFANSGEMVGQFSNGRTAVANNDQIVTGITQGVYSAMMAYNAQTRGQGGSGDVYLDGTKVGRVVAKGSHQEMVRTGLIKANS
jgi:hypothetical protein